MSNNYKVYASQQYVDEKFEKLDTELILSSPGGKRFIITIGDDGVLSANEIVEEDN